MVKLKSGFVKKYKVGSVKSLLGLGNPLKRGRT